MRSLRPLLLILASGLVLGLDALPAYAVGAPFMVRDIHTGSPSSTPRNLLSLGNRLFLIADDGVTGLEPWVSDGTAAGTFRLADIRLGPDGSATGAGATAAGGIAIFASTDGTSARQVWRTDGTIAGTWLFDSNSVPSGFGTGGSTLYFAGSEGATSQSLLHVTDGTVAGTHVVSTQALLSGTQIIDVGGREFFPADDGTHGTEVWSSDGTAGGTAMAADLTDGNSGPSALASAGGLAYFFVTASGPNHGLCRSDGTASGTFLLKNLSFDVNAQDGHQIVDLNGTAYIVAVDATHGAELWKSDGTPGGTVMVKDINPGTADGIVRSGLAVLGNFLYFCGDDGVNGPELWRSDGTAAGTQMFDEIYPGSGGSYPLYLRSLGGSLFFTAVDFYFGNSPWISDGTVAGTQSLGNITPGNGGQATPSFTLANGYVFFTGHDDSHGDELWAVGLPTTAVAPPTEAAQASLALSAPAPNPLRGGRATLHYTLGASGHVRLSLLDVTGRERQRVIDEFATAGTHDATLATGALAAGLYFLRLESGGRVVQGRAVVLRP